MAPAADDVVHTRHVIAAVIHGFQTMHRRKNGSFLAFGFTRNRLSDKFDVTASSSFGLVDGRLPVVLEAGT